MLGSELVPFWYPWLQLFTPKCIKLYCLLRCYYKLSSIKARLNTNKNPPISGQEYITKFNLQKQKAREKGVRKSRRSKKGGYSMTTLTTNDSSRFSRAERPVILAMLEEFTNVLAIYHSSLKKPTDYDKDILVDYLLLNTQEEASNAEKIMRIKEAKERAVSRKLYENSLYLKGIMEELKKEIREQGTFQLLTREIDRIESREKEQKALVLKEERLKKTATKLQKMLAEEKMAHKEEKRRMRNELSEDQRNIEKLKLIADAELKYVTEWEKARCEQNSLRCDMEIEKFEKILNDRRAREKNEQRVHAELSRFLIQETESLEKETKEWEERYVREKEMYEKEIWLLRIEIGARRKELDELKEEYRRNQGFIDTYLAEKEALRKEKERRELMQKSAIKVQAWWRGVMVRRKLGPYRPTEKKKKRQAKTKK